MSSYQDWLRCLRVGDYVNVKKYYWDSDYRSYSAIFVEREIREIKQLSTNKYKFIMDNCDDEDYHDYDDYDFYDASRPLPCDPLIEYHQNPYQQNYQNMIHFCKECKYKCIYSNSFIIHRFDRMTRKYLDSYCKSCYIKLRYQFLYTLITYYFDSQQMYKNIDINIISLVTEYSFETTTKIECGYTMCENTIQFDTISIEDEINPNINHRIELLPISTMKKEVKCSTPCESCSKLSLRETQCDILHGDKYKIDCNARHHTFCTKCDSKPIRCESSIDCYNMICSIQHCANLNYRSCADCARPYDHYDEMDWMMDGQEELSDYECFDDFVDDKSFRKQRFKMKNKKKNKLKLKNKSYLKRKNDRKPNKSSMRKWNKKNN